MWQEIIGGMYLNLIGIWQQEVLIVYGKLRSKAKPRHFREIRSDITKGFNILLS